MWRQAEPWKKRVIAKYPLKDFFLFLKLLKKTNNRKKVVFDILESYILVHKAVLQMKRFLFMNKQ